MTKAFIHCYLPQGLTLQLGDGKKHVAPTGRNDIDADFWAVWAKENADYAPFVSGKIVLVQQEVATPVAAAPEPAQPEPTK